jgi:AdoMet-dependent heme synthase
MPRPDRAQLSHAEGIDLLRQFVELAPDVVVLTGGDPLKRPDLRELVEQAVARRLRVALAPSVTPLLTRRALADLVAAGVGRVALSLDGPRAVHDAFRGVPGSFDRTLEAVDAVRATGAALQVNTSLDRRTLAALPETAELVAALRPALWSVFVVVPVGRASAATTLDADACERVFATLYDWAARTGLAVKTTAAPAFRRYVVQRRAAERPNGTRLPTPGSVNEGRGFVFVSHTGDVYPSGFLPIRVGNVRHARLAQLYRTHRLFVALRAESRLEGKCGQCRYRFLCGGSRARAFATTGDPLAEDPACAYDPATDMVRERVA